MEEFDWSGLILVLMITGILLGMRSCANDPCYYDSKSKECLRGSK